MTPITPITSCRFPIMAVLLLLAILTAAGQAWCAPVLTLKRAMLSTGGVGYFEYEAVVSDDAELFLEVRRDRVDDVLKSIVVYDDKGGIGTISLPGQEPLKDLFRELPFGEVALESPSALLAALRGAEVRVSGRNEVSGRLLSVTEEQAQGSTGGTTITRHRLALMTADGLRQVILEDVDAIKLADIRLQSRLDAVLAAIARHGERDRRTLTLHTTGKGERVVRVAYVVGAPLWKTTYRLTLDVGNAAGGGLQGWAVLENTSGEDWNGVDLTVVSGQPVTFRQALYEAYYVNRPEVPVEVLGRVLPKVDQGGVSEPLAPLYRKGLRGLALNQMEEGASSGAAPASAPAQAQDYAPMAPPRMAAVAAAESTEGATQITFHHPRPVSVANGHSLLLPIVNRKVPGARLALYQPATEPRHPLAAVRLVNDGTSGLPPGILTLYERANDGTVAYVGDARLSPLPAGQQRLLSFAVDQKVTIDRANSFGQLLTRARIADGVLETVTTERNTTRYTIAGAAREPRTVVIEHPRRSGWDLIEAAPGTPASTPAAETTADAWRITVEVGAGKTVVVPVTTERPRQDRFEMVNLPAEQVEVFAAAHNLPAELKRAVARVAELRAVVAMRQKLTARLERDAAEVIRDQQRLRDNLQAVGQGTDIGRRYLNKLGEQEDRLEALGKEQAGARASEEVARQAVTDYVKGLAF
ncbi:MAG: DUF4139 domain-containing protein [Rhodospirillaceae bacterium]